VFQPFRLGIDRGVSVTQGVAQRLELSPLRREETEDQRGGKWMNICFSFHRLTLTLPHKGEGI
jgi:hypothetical protein